MNTYYVHKTVLPVLPGVAPLFCFHIKHAAREHVGYVCSIYGGFAPTHWNDLLHGFKNKRQANQWAQNNGFAIYWLTPESPR